MLRKPVAKREDIEYINSHKEEFHWAPFPKEMLNRPSSEFEGQAFKLGKDYFIITSNPDILKPGA